MPRREALRKEMRTVLAGLDRRWLDAASREMCVRLGHFVEREVGRAIDHILAWNAFFPGEVDLSAFLRAQLGRRKIYFPCTYDDGTMRFFGLTKSGTVCVHSGRFGIPEPEANPAEEYDLSFAPLTLILVPGLAFDRRGGRIGRGKGFYDRFLSQGGISNAVKVGVGWSLQVLSELPIRPHDVRMNFLCMERDCVRCEDHD